MKLKEDVFMWRMRAKDVLRFFQDASEDSIGHGVTNRDISEAFHAADNLMEALVTIERKLEGES